MGAGECVDLLSGCTTLAGGLGARGAQGLCAAVEACCARRMERGSVMVTGPSVRFETYGLLRRILPVAMVGLCSVVE